ncbi:hypothetical protein [Streptomyces coffeae]|uniref:Uncharacterized protein n=1 Tax=Streptomyces coffeae TaxID=621382 RepID=A0ABS1NP06_9ACTN|nr:hypothetical protein [Streptomyces coffeae]MBL1101813.1 hypothetical protein [Streptomyces coffeae]
MKTSKLKDAMQVEAAAGYGDQASGVFVTLESLTFPTSAVLVSFLLNVLSRPVKGASTSFWWALGVSSVVGAIVYAKSLTDEMPLKTKVMGGFVAVINVLVLTGTALGAGSLATNSPVKL